MLASLRTYRSPALLATLALVLGAFSPLASCPGELMAMGEDPRAPMNDTAMPCHSDEEASPAVPDAPVERPSDTPCAMPECCVVQATQAPPSVSTAPVTALAAPSTEPVAVLPIMRAPSLPVAPDESPPASSVARSILYNCFLT